MEAINQKERMRRRVLKGHPVKLTALLYLKQALQEEQYEICADLIGIAKEFGASDLEVKFLLEDPRRNPT